jgi:hypothetical protein
MLVAFGRLRTKQRASTIADWLPVRYIAPMSDKITYEV